MALCKFCMHAGGQPGMVQRRDARSGLLRWVPCKHCHGSTQEISVTDRVKAS